jgi:hypothetical protein
MLIMKGLRNFGAEWRRSLRRLTVGIDRDLSQDCLRIVGDPAFEDRGDAAHPGYVG